MAVFHRKLWVNRDNKSRLKLKGIEINRMVLRSLIANLKQNYNKKIYYSKIFNKWGKFYCISYYRRSCVRSGTGRSVFKLFKYSRHECKRLSAKGLLIGMRKASF